MKQYMCCLLVEDDPEDQEFFLELFHIVLPDHGCYAVSNGEEALYTLLHEELVPDIIFTDLNMPKMGGLDFMLTLKRIETFKDIPVIVYTSDCSEEHIHAAKTLGAVGIYSKTRRDALGEILKKYFQSSANSNYSEWKKQTR